MRMFLSLLLAALATSASAAPTRLLISFKAGATAQERAAALKALGVDAVDTIDEIETAVAEVPAGRLFALDTFQAAAAAQPAVDVVEQDVYRNWLVGQQVSFQNSALPSFGEAMAALPRFESRVWQRPVLPPGLNAAELPWGILRVDAPHAWAKTQGEGVRVAVIDTGIDLNHPDLKANIAGGYNALGGSSYGDDNGHGSHVAGTIAGVLDGKGVVGVAPKAKLFAVKVLDKDGGGGLVSIIKGLVWCGKNNIQVANMSLGAPIGTIFMRAAVKYAQMKGVVIIAAAGNSGGAVESPGNYPETIAVAASDIQDHIADFSSRGNEVEFIAPGVDVKSSVPGGAYDTYDGTSMATPHVAGLAALAISRGARGVDGVRAAFKRAAKPLPGLKPTEQGAGMIDAAILVR